MMASSSKTACTTGSGILSRIRLSRSYLWYTTAQTHHRDSRATPSQGGPTSGTPQQGAQHKQGHPWGASQHRAHRAAAQAPLRARHAGRAWGGRHVHSHNGLHEPGLGDLEVEGEGALAGHAQQLHLRAGLRLPRALAAAVRLLQLNKGTSQRQEQDTHKAQHSARLRPHKALGSQSVGRQRPSCLCWPSQEAGTS